MRTRKFTEPSLRMNRLRGKWWSYSNDLQATRWKRSYFSNQNIAASFAAYMQARAIVREARAMFFPSASLAPSFATQGGPNLGTSSTGVPTAGTYSQYQIPLEASWAPDLWGKIRNTVKQDEALAQVSEGSFGKRKTD